MKPSTDPISSLPSIHVDEIQRLLDRANHGDADSRRQLMTVTYDRLCKLAGKILVESFPALRNTHDVNSIVHETWLRLDMALDKTVLPTAADYFRFAAHKIRHVLLDMIERQRKLSRPESIINADSSLPDSPAEQSHSTYDPRRLSEWTDFHQRVQQLEPDLRSVFELHYYLELPQSEIAKLLELHPRKVSYLWIAATESLADAFEK